MSAAPSEPDSETAALFRGPGEIRALAAALDWSASPLGPVSAWPQSLRSTVRTLLSSQYPMILTWGSAFTQIYNDAYARLIGDQHPAALGIDIRVTLAAGWDTLGPMIARVMETGDANWTPALPLLMERAGYREEAYFSVSHGPAEDDAGRIVGMLAVCSEVTAQVVGERRLHLLRDLGVGAGETRSVETTCADLVAALAGDPLDIPFALLYLADSSGTLTLAGKTGIADDHPAASATLAPDATEAAWPWGSVLADHSETVPLPEAVLDIRGGLWNDPIRCARAMPIAGTSGTPPLGMLVLGISPSRAFDDDYDAFFRLIAGQAGTALRNARAHEEERRRTEALAEIDRAKTQFFSNVSHEFRTPLTLMLGPLEDVLSWDSLGNTVRAELQVAHRNALRLLRLVNTLLDFSRVEAGRTEAAFEPLDLSALTIDLASNFRSAVERGGLDFTVDCPPLAEPAYVDREMWEKIVLNLVSNAFKYTFAGRIAVRLDAEDGAARLTVADTGVGIPADEQARVFERFHRIEGIRSRSHEGSGIGLALVRELVGMHGGTVAVESAVRQGTTFTVRIPLGKAHLPADRVLEAGSAGAEGRGAAPYVEEALRWLPAEAKPRASNVVPLHPEAETGTDERPSIVLADDNADMRAYVERLLGTGYAVRTVGDGAEALIALKASPADLLVTDVMMPVLDGIGLVREVRRDPALRMLPVIMLSARAGEEAGLEGLEAGADDYLVKPFSARELLARVRANLELARLRRETEEQAAQARKMEAVGQLTSGIAHDFNNLLAAIMGSVELSERRVADERVLRLLNNAMQAAQRGAKLTEQLLAFSRKQRLDTRPVDVNRILSGMADLLQRTLGGTVGVSTRLAKDLWTAKADPTRLELAILNLAVNARDAMPDGGELTIETANLEADAMRPPGLADGDFVRLRVSDTGEGMSAEVMARLFEPFFTTKAQGKGTGLGLAQVYGTAKQLGGEVTVESRLGAGTTVTLYLPRTAHAVVPRPESERTIPGGDGESHILVVDDDAQVRATTVDLLEELGYAISTADSGSDALRALETGLRVDLLLADFAMPAMNGAELRLRAQALRPDLPVLLMTGYADAAMLPPGSARVLRKPFALADLALAVASILNAEGAAILHLPTSDAADGA